MIGTALHPRTEPLCISKRWKEWSGYHAVSRYDLILDYEYSAIRNRAGMLDVSPLYKYRIRGKDATRVLDRMVPRDVTKCRVGQVLYAPWCDDDGNTIDDGTIQRLGEQDFRLTSAHPNLLWLDQVAGNAVISVEEESESVAAVSLQGPMSREVLRAGGVDDIDDLRFFHVQQAELGGHPVEISRTGYTGDLGYEIWFGAETGPDVWDFLMSRGADYGITPFGLDVLDVCRIEAGLILIDVDYNSSLRTKIESRKSTPFEIGLGWTVNPKKTAPYIGKEALQRQREAGIPRTIVGLELHWEEVEDLFEKEDLPIEVHEGACREPVPVYDHGKQVGYTTSQCWSPILKKSIALATVQSPHDELGTRLQVEHTVEYQRKAVTATVVKKPFYDPPRKRGGK